MTCGGPREDFRAYMSDQAAQLETENQFDDLLGQLKDAMANDLETGLDSGDGSDLLASVSAWAGLASYIASRFYAPASPWPRRVGGWGKRAVKRLQSTTGRLVPALRAAVGVLGASGFSISISFPWGIAIAINW